jgi:DNA polymerase elongation subunit (family B)
MACTPYTAVYAQLRAAVGRPPATDTPAAGQRVTFQILDVVVSDSLACGVAARELASRAAEAPVSIPAATVTVTLFGATADGRSVACHVTGFRLACHIRFSSREGLQAVEAWLRRRGAADYRWQQQQHYNFAGFTWDAATGQRVRNSYLRVDCPSVKAYDALRWVASNLPQHDLEVVEHAGVPLYTKFYDATQLTPFQWVTVTCADMVERVATTCDVELRCCMGGWADEPALRAPAPYLFASCDIEAHSTTGEFPNKVNAGDAAFMVGVVLQRFGSAATVNASFVYDDTVTPATVHTVVAGRDGPIHVIRYPTERAMLEGWRDCVCVWLDADLVMWYNGFRFDLDYMAYRVLGVTPCPQSCRLDPAFPRVGSRFFQFSKFVRACTPVRTKTLTSAAMGDNELCVWADEHGRITLDLYDMVCKREKMSSYSLDSVCRKVLKVTGGTVSWARGGTRVTGEGTRFTRLKPGDGIQLAEEFYAVGAVASDTALDLAAVPIDIDADVVAFPMTGQVTKIDLPYKRMHELYARREFDAIVDYCCRDCVAPLQLLWKLRYFLNDYQMCKVTFTPLQQLLSRGQGIKGLNQVIRFAHAKGFLLNQFPDMAQVDYQGATVVEPMKGFHTNPVVTLDFASLYPSIIISRHMCWTTVVTDQRYAEVPGIQYHEVAVSEGVSYRFAANVDAVCPELLKALLAARKATKREMAAAPDADTAALLNAKQLAEKICCNAMYGLTGAKSGLLRCVAIACSTTAYGRQTLERTKALAVQHLQGTEIIYGDSVTPDTPVLCRVTDAAGCRIVYRAIDEVGDGAWVPSPHGGGKEECAPLPGHEVWSDTGFTAIRRVIRHACGKRLVRVLTRVGVVDVTTDHSLLTPQGERVSPADVRVGQPLLHAEFPQSGVADGVPAEHAYVWGLFLAAGTCAGEEWAISKPDSNGMERARRALAAMEPAVTFTAMHASDVYTLTASGDVAGLAARWRGTLYRSGRAAVPDAVLNAPLGVRRAFWEGFRAGNRYGHATGKLAAAGLCYLITSLGHAPEVDAQAVRDEYTLTVGGPGEGWEVQRVDDLPAYSGAVYDLETDSHHFAAGVGRMVVHNTDSIMVKFHGLAGDRAGIEAAWAAGLETAGWITRQLANGIVLESEKVYCPYLLLAKKTYAALKYESTTAQLPAVPCRDVKGLELQKRDTSKFIRQAQSRVVNCLLATADRDAAVRLVAAMVEDVCLLRVPLAEFVTSKSLRSDYKAARVVQREVNERRRARAPGSEYKPGERVPMVAVEQRGKGQPLLTERDSACELMDDPDYVAAQGWRPNRRYYLTDLHRKVGRVLPDEAGRLDALFRTAFAYMESLKYRSIVPFRLRDKLGRCVARK